MIWKLGLSDTSIATPAPVIYDPVFVTHAAALTSKTHAAPSITVPVVCAAIVVDHTGDDFLSHPISGRLQVFMVMMLYGVWQTARHGHYDGRRHQPRLPVAH